MRRPTQLASGFVVHLVFAGVLVVFLAVPVLPPPPARDTRPLIWTARPGFDGGGGGGDGTQASPAPLRRVVERPEPQFRLPRMPAALSSLELPGTSVLYAAVGANGSGAADGQAKGRGEGAGGPGSGPRDGPGVGSGDGPFLDGAPGLTSPQVIFEQKPAYTAEAMRARIHGAVLLEATVRDDGSVGAVKVLRSIDASFGLDQEAVTAVRAWRFRPGTYQGKPVAVKVLIELLFTLR